MQNPEAARILEKLSARVESEIADVYGMFEAATTNGEQKMLLARLITLREVTTWLDYARQEG